MDAGYGGAEAGWTHIVTRTHLTPQASSAVAFELGAFDREGFGGTLGRFLGRRLSVFANLHFDDTTTFTQVANADRSRFWGKARFYLAREHFVEAAVGTSGAATDTRRATPGGPSPFAESRSVVSFDSGLYGDASDRPDVVAYQGSIRRGG